jgi:hypothetical protein
MVTILALLFCCTAAASGGFERADAGARSRGAGGASLARSGDAWSALVNPAGLARIRGPQAGFHVSPAPFGLSELSYKAAVAAVPLPFGAAALSASVSGYSLYTEQNVGCSLAFRLPGFDAGISIVRSAASIERYGSAATLGVDAGIVADLIDGLRAGLRLRRLNGPTIGASAEPLAHSAAVGVAFVPDRAIELQADVEKEERREPALRVGVEASIVPELALRLGFADHPSTLHCGAGIVVGAVAFDYAYIHHQDLGPTQEWSLTVRLGETVP